MYSPLRHSFQKEHACTFAFDAIAIEAAAQLAATRGCLEGAKVCLAEPRRPIGRQRAMRAPCYRVFGDTLGWGEVPADAIMVAITRCRHDHARARHYCDGGQVGGKPANVARRGEPDDEVGAVPQRLLD